MTKAKFKYSGSHCSAAISQHHLAYCRVDAVFAMLSGRVFSEKSLLESAIFFQLKKDKFCFQRKGILTKKLPDTDDRVPILQLARYRNKKINQNQTTLMGNE